MAAEGAMPARVVRWITREDVDWDAVYAEQLPRVFNFFRYRCANPADAEDLTSITFEKAWRARDRYRRDKGGFSTWLFTIARNAAIDYYRRANDSRPDRRGRHGGRHRHARGRHRQAVRRAAPGVLLQTLSDRDRELIALKYGAEMTNRDIARATGLSESNVGTILHRAVQALRERW